MTFCSFHFGFPGQEFLKTNILSLDKDQVCTASVEDILLS